MHPYIHKGKNDNYNVLPKYSDLFRIEGNVVNEGQEHRHYMFRISGRHSELTVIPVGSDHGYKNIAGNEWVLVNKHVKVE